jgi:hypothetical protein
MNRTALKIFIALLTFSIGVVAYAGWKSLPAFQNQNSEPNMVFIVAPATSKDTVLFDWDAYLNENCIRRNPEREKLLNERFNRVSRKSKR